MKTSFLFPNQFKRIGWLIFIPGVVLGLLFLINEPDIPYLNTLVFSMAGQEVFGKNVFFSFTENNVLDELAGVLIILGAMFIAFSKEKTEDEFISKIRLESLVWATYVNYAVLILAIIFVFDMMFFWVLVFNMFTILIFFIIRFNWALAKARNQIQDEE